MRWMLCLDVAEAHLYFVHGNPTGEPIAPCPSLACMALGATAGIAQVRRQGELGPGVPYHILAWEAMI